MADHGEGSGTVSEDMLCDSCAATLPLPDSTGAILCPACGRVAKVAQPVAHRVSPAPARAVRKRWVPWAVFAGLIALLGLLMVFDQPDESTSTEASTSSPYTPTGRLVEVLEGDDAGSMEAIVTVSDRDGNASDQQLIRTTLVGEGAGDVVWTSEAFPYAAAVDAVVSGDALFAVVDDEVWHLSLATGERQWQAPLPDVVSRDCAGCVAVLDDTLVVKTAEGTISAFASTSAEPRWSRRLASADASSVFLYGRVVLLDAGEGGAAEVVAIDPSTGAEIGATMPTCAAPGDTELSVTGDLIAVPVAEGQVVAKFGPGNRCLSRIDTNTGQQVWTSTDLPSLVTSSGPSFVAGDDLVLATSSSPGVHVDLATGEITELEDYVDHRVIPRAIYEGTLVAETVSTRGTPRAGVAAWDLSTGARSWETRVPGDAAPVDSTYGPQRLAESEPRSLLHTDGDRPLLVSFDAASLQVRVHPLDAATGDLGAPSEQPFTVRYENDADLSLEVIDSGPARLSVRLADLLQVVPLPDGEIVSWPPPD